MSWRSKAYGRGLLQRWRPPSPCISVGNIRWGGTGKTPVCHWLLNWASQSGMNCVVLTRGYRARPPALPFLVRPDSSAAEAGDEPLLLARANLDAHIVIDPKRIRSGNWAWQQWRPDLFLLDDGFQHLPVIRDINLALLLPQDLDRDWNRVVPGGPWREGAKALARADAFLIKLVGLDEVPTALRDLIATRLSPFDKPIFFFAPSPGGLTNLQTAEQVDRLPEKHGSSYMLVSGVANPALVDHTASTLLGAAPRRHDAFADHHAFSRREIEDIVRKAGSAGVGHVVCTAKDAVKIRELLGPDTPVQWWSMDMTVRFVPESEKSPCFVKWLEQRLKTARQYLSGNMNFNLTSRIPNQ
ncbi:lipid-A-disaccharide kinase [Desulfonatronum thiosulfatophilum]|uniref:Tetraacyldisaccharide 4'-kinase n=2 Tax=Desulfonatronum thiosulfatophilum TaxID=617002 RepID=A0A1G6ENJ2_9BACT|nr:lipid-A-disaccharide kinase [Desulfonatronum thiosulfatophilum]